MFGDPPVPPVMTTAPFVLAADDGAADRRLLDLAFAELEAPCRLHVVPGGRELLEHLADERSERPDLILLDLNMPDVHGLDLLTTLKQDPELRSIPVVMLTTSAARDDRRAAYDRHANAFVRKPVDVDEFFAVVRELVDFWLVRAERP